MFYNAFISYSHAADGKLAPQVQRGLHQFAKPLFRLRALRVFRDETSLAATPGLWPVIVQALSRSEYFILMASPEAAESVWVNDEVRYWLHDSPAAREGTASRRLLLVLTAGEVRWDREANDFDWSLTDALPKTLEKVFSGEPRYVDLRQVRTAEDVSLRNPEFRSRIADLAATLHGREKDDLIGEDVRIARRSRLLGAVAVGVLVLMSVVAGTAAFVANAQRKDARSREFAARADAALDSSPDSSLVLAIQAVEWSPTAEAVAALRVALVESTARAVLRLPDEVDAVHFLADGRLVFQVVDSTGAPSGLVFWDWQRRRHPCLVPAVSGEVPGSRTRTRASASGAARAYDHSGCLRGDRTPVTEADVAAALAPHPLEGVVKPFAHLHPFRDSISSRVVSRPRSEVVPPWPSELRDMRTGRVIREFQDPIGLALFFHWGDTTGVVTAPVKYAYDYQRGQAVTHADETEVRVWNAVSGAPSVVLSGHRAAINAAAVDADESLLVTGSDDHTARLWNLRTGESFAVLRGHRGPVTGVAVSPDGVYIATISEDGTARVWEEESGYSLESTTAEILALRYGRRLPGLKGSNGTVSLPTPSEDGSRLVALDADYYGDNFIHPDDMVDHDALLVWDARTGALLRVLPEATMGALSPNGSRIVITDADVENAMGSDGVDVVDVASGAGIGRLHQPGPVYWVGYSPDGRTIATGSDDGSVRFWDARTLRPNRTLKVSDDRVIHAGFSADGELLAVASRDAVIRVYEVATGRLLHELVGHESGALFAGFSPDGSLILSVGIDGTRVWDASNGRLLGLYSGELFDPFAFITPGCDQLVSGAETSVTVYRFEACGSVDHLLAVARSQVAVLHSRG